MQTGTAPVVPTPNLDALASQGMMFTDAHTPAALSARHPLQFDDGQQPCAEWPPVGHLELAGFLGVFGGVAHDTLGDVMQAAGYRTSFIGKMHFGGQPKDASGNVTHDYTQIDFSKPIGDGMVAHGFDYSYGLHSGQQNPPYVYFENDMFAPIDSNKPANNSSIQDWAPGTYPKSDGSVSTIENDNNPYRPGDVDWDSSKVGDQLSQKAVDFIDNHLQQNTAAGETKPFFMYYASQAIHFPHTPPNNFGSTPVRGTTINNKTDMIKELDLQVGRIVQKLQDEGLADDTLIVFTSDNGALGDQGGELAAGHNSAGGLRGFKGGPFEGGSRVPFIAKWGDGTTEGSYIPPGTSSDQLVMAQDWAATLYDLTRQDMANDQAQDSTTLLPLLFGQQSENDPLRSFAVMQSQTDAAKPHMIRMDDSEGEWMMLLNGSRQAVDLYNLSTDLAQTTNLVNDTNQQSRVTAMRQLFLQHDQENDARSTAPFTAANATSFPGGPQPPETANTISINLTNGDQSVTTPYGVVASSVWTNSTADNLTNVVDDTDAATTMDVLITDPGNRNYYGATYIGTPMHTGPQFFDGTDDGTTITLTDIPYDEYKVVVYLAGFTGNPGAKVTDGTTTYYWDSPDPADATLVQTTDVDASDGIDVANYAVFGWDDVPLTSSTLSLTFSLYADGLSGGAGVGGLQVIEILPLLVGDYNNNGVVDAADYTVYRDNLGADSSVLQNNRIDGPVGAEHYSQWRNNFGATRGASAAASAAVPEPAAWTLGAALAIAATATRSRRGERAAAR